MKSNIQPVWWIVWHPHQRLWNWTLIQRLQQSVKIAPLRKIIGLTIIYLDTLLLWLRALRVRVFKLSPLYLFHKAQIPDDLSVLYLDIGTHKEGLELSIVVDEILPSICRNFQAYGFEASQTSFEQVAENFAQKTNVELIHKALVHTVPPNGKIKLFKDMDNGIADSIYRPSEQYEEVECMRLSDFLIDKDLVQTYDIILLRMNIEGSEYEVIQDLVEHKLHHLIDGYFGMWDDVSKIDVKKDEQFRAFLAQNNINTFTFNGRDLSRSIRKKCIIYHLHTRILQKLRFISKKGKNSTDE